MEINYKITKDEFIEAEKLFFSRIYNRRVRLIVIGLSIFVIIYNLFNEKSVINFALNTIIPITLLILLLIIEGKCITILHKKKIAKKVEKFWSEDERKIIISEQYIKYFTSEGSYEVSKDRVHVYEIKEYIYIEFKKNKVLIIPKSRISQENTKRILKINR